MNSSQSRWLSLSLPWTPLSALLVAGSAYAMYLEGDRFIKVVVNPKTTLSNYIYQVTARTGGRPPSPAAPRCDVCV